MAQLISKQFRVALIYLFAQEGRGAQTRLANEQRIDRGYLNAIVKGRKSGSENIRAKVAAHFHMVYEDMLILGRQILERGEEQSSEEDISLGLVKAENPRFGEKEKEIIAFKNHQGNEKLPLEISNKVLKVIEILHSGTSYGDILAGLIDTFHEAISMKEEDLVSQNRLKSLEDKMANLERRMVDKKSFI
ncbi:hypothetical protein KJ612_19250 [Myxococcota bacterium]|nr:hypothetical protein [Myxococcota bacterium]MBU1413907.1 hypothetical protein [Myxococcota bacterium]